MRIAQIAPLYESCPPRLYGGTERVVSYLTEELVRMGHEVTLFASGDSRTSARLVPGCRSRSAARRPSVTDPFAYHMILMNRVRQKADEFDIMHFHTDYLHFPTFAESSMPIVTTMHGRQDLPDLQPIFREFVDMPLVSISDHQRRPVPRAAWIRTIHHGLPRDLLPYGAGRRRLPGLYRPHQPGKGARPCDPHRLQGRHPAEDRGQGGQDGRRLFPRGDRAAALRRRRVRRRDRRGREEELPRKTPARCCSRSTGRSRSAW